VLPSSNDARELDRAVNPGKVSHMAQRDVLIVSNTPQIRQVFHDILLTAGYQCLLAADGREAFEIFRGWRPSLVVTDLNLPVMSGIELLQRVREEDPDAAVIVVCGAVVKQGEAQQVVGFLDVEGTRSACLKLGAYAMLQKPMLMEELLLAAEGALERRRLLVERRERQGRIPADFRRLADVSELLAMFAAVFAAPARAPGRTFTIAGRGSR